MGRALRNLSLLVLVQAFVPVLAFAQAPAEIGSIEAVEALLFARDAAGVTRPMQARSPVYEGDVIVVAPGGYASLRMVDNAHISLGPGTEFRFTQYRYDGRSGTRDSVVMNLLQGCFRATGGRVGSAERDEYRIETAVANIAAGGSLHGAKLVEDRLYTATWDGVTVISNALGSLSLGKYGEPRFSRTLPGSAPIGLGAELPDAVCKIPDGLKAEER